MRYVSVTKEWLDRYERATDPKRRRLENLFCFLAGICLPQAIIQPILHKNLWWGIALGIIGTASLFWMIMSFRERHREIRKLLQEVETNEVSQLR